MNTSGGCLSHSPAPLALPTLVISPPKTPVKNQGHNERERENNLIEVIINDALCTLN
jgi:hypothetical protein